MKYDAGDPRNAKEFADSVARLGLNTAPREEWTPADQLRLDEYLSLCREIQALDPIDQLCLLWGVVGYHGGCPEFNNAMRVCLEHRNDKT